MTPELFRRYRTPNQFAGAVVEELEAIVRPTGFYHNKTKSLIGASKLLVAEFGGEVPKTMAELIRLPGVSRKTASVAANYRGGQHRQDREGPDGTAATGNVDHVRALHGLARAAGVCGEEAGA